MSRAVRFFGEINPTGAGRFTESAFFAMHRQRPRGTLVEYFDRGRENHARRLVALGRGAGGATLLFWRMEVASMPLLPGRRIGWLFFETDRLPPRWIDEMRAFDELWMPSGWARDVLIEHGIDESRVRVVEGGVDPRVFHPRPLAHEGFSFLLVGKYEGRKSVDEVIAAFREEFPPGRNRDVSLVLKVDHLIFGDRIQSLIARHADDPRIRFVTGQIPDHEMAALYNRSDAFVLPTKAEGFGLPTIEALACGVPVVTTDYSAQTAFLGHVPGLFHPVEYDLRPIEDPDYAHFYGSEYAGTPFGRWAVPRPASLRAAMREVYDNAGTWKDRAGRASEIIRARFAWDEIARKIYSTLGPT